MEDEADTKSGDLQGVRKKYLHKRRQHTSQTSRAWQGPSHKKFSEYFNNTSDSSASDSRTSNDEEDDSINKKQYKSDDSDSLILPMKSTAQSKVQPHQILSESEPEDPEEVRIHQEKLKARRSRIITNMSTVSVVGKQQDNLTLNMTNNRSKFIPTRLSEVAPDLLDLSSESEDVEEGDDLNNKVQFILKESDSEEIPATSSRKMSTSKSRISVEPIIEAVLTGSESNVGDVVVCDTSPGTPEKIKTPLKRNSPATATSGSESIAKRRKSQRISTPKPKNVTVLKVLDQSKRRSKFLNSQSQQVISQMDSPAGTLNSTGIKKRTSRNSIVKNGTLLSTGKSPSPNKSHLKPNGDVSLTRPKSPSFEPILSIEENSIPTSNNDLTEIANEEPALPSTMRNSLRKKKSLTENTVNTSRNDDSLRENQFSKSLRSSLSHSTKLTLYSPPPVSVEKMPEKLVENHNVVLEENSSYNTRLQFMAMARPANDCDPIQYSLIYQSPTLFTIMWKLQPKMANFFRTRGKAMILVLEGSIQIEGKQYKRGVTVPLNKNVTYCVTSGDTIALFQVVEFL